MKFLLAIIAALLPSVVFADHISDVKGWRENGLVVVSEWNNGGFPPSWHIGQIRNGYRIVPTVKLPVLGAGQPIPIFTTDDENFLRTNALPICIRTDNIGSIISGLPRVPLPLKIEDIGKSAVVWTFDGTLYHDQSLNDAFADPMLWRKAGNDWAKLPPTQTLQTKFPNAAYLILADNGEVNEDKSGFYAKLMTNDQYGYWANPQWLPDLQKRSVRAYLYSQVVGNTAETFTKEFNGLRSTQYKSLFAGFDDALVSWKGRLITESYGVASISQAGLAPYPPSLLWSNLYTPDFGHYDGGGTGIYQKVTPDNKPIFCDYTSIDWLRFYYFDAIARNAETLNPNHFREVFVSMSDQGCLWGWRNSKHDVMTPERIRAFAEWMMWNMKGDRKPVMIRHWLGSAVKPTDPFVTDDDKADFITAGYADLATSKQHDFIVPFMEAANLIATEPYRSFYQKGQVICTGTNPLNDVRYNTYNKAATVPGDVGYRLLDCDLNSPRSEFVIPPGPMNKGIWNPAAVIKVWGTAIRLDDQILVHLWSPCKLTGKCKITIPNVGTFEVGVPQPNKHILLKSGWSATELP